MSPNTTQTPNLLPNRMTDQAEPPTSINLFTLNCWGLLYISTLRTPRLDEIGRQIALQNPVPDIVCLQECWVQDDYRAIRRRTKQFLPYGKFYHSGAFGGGLAILSRWPIEESSMFKYPLNGRPTAFWRGDWYVGKGVACAKVRFGAGKKDVIEVFNTHVSPPSLSLEAMTYTNADTRTLRERTQRLIHLPPHCPSLGDLQTHPRSHRTWSPHRGPRRLQHDPPLARSPPHHLARPRPRRLARAASG